MKDEEVQMEGSRHMRTSIVNRLCAAEESHPREQQGLEI
jgi:hypothetical protein